MQQFLLEGDAGNKSTLRRIDRILKSRLTNFNPEHEATKEFVPPRDVWLISSSD